MISLRQVEYADLKKIKEWRNKYCEFFRQTKLLNNLDQENWLESLGTDQSREYKNVMFSVCENNILIGVCGLTNIDWKNKSAELSFITENYTDDRCFEIIDKLLEWCFNNYGLHSAWVEIYSNDNHKKKFLAKYGFIKTGYKKDTYYWHGRYWNSIFYCLTKKQWIELKKRISCVQ
jgi:RimJ/RimL family protein N-acetyltransferase